jgi:hypothetical protein
LKDYWVFGGVKGGVELRIMKIIFLGDVTKWVIFATYRNRSVL